MTLTQFIATYNYHHIDVDGYPSWQPYQCVDETNLYLAKVFSLPYFHGNAYQWFTNFNSTMAKKFTKVTNDHNNAKQVPKYGAILVYARSLPGSGGNGHVEIFLKSLPGGGFQTFSQNWNGTFAHYVTHSVKDYRYVMGWLNPKTSAAKPSSKPTPAASYTIKRGDILSRIASRYHTTLTALLKKNPKIKNPNIIYPGEKINVK